MSKIRKRDSHPLFLDLPADLAVNSSEAGILYLLRGRHRSHRVWDAGEGPLSICRSSSGGSHGQVGGGHDPALATPFLGVSNTRAAGSCGEPFPSPYRHHQQPLPPRRSVLGRHCNPEYCSRHFMCVAFFNSQSKAEGPLLRAFQRHLCLSSVLENLS